MSKNSSLANSPLINRKDSKLMKDQSNIGEASLV